MELALKILGDLIGAILPPLLNWFFSGTVTNVVKEVTGLPQLDNKTPDQPPVLPLIAMPGDGQ